MQTPKYYRKRQLRAVRKFEALLKKELTGTLSEDEQLELEVLKLRFSWPVERPKCRAFNQGN